MEDRVRTDSAANRSDQYVPGVLAGRPSQNVARLGAAITTSSLRRLACFYEAVPGMVG